MWWSWLIRHIGIVEYFFGKWKEYNGTMWNSWCVKGQGYVVGGWLPITEMAGKLHPPQCRWWHGQVKKGRKYLRLHRTQYFYIFNLCPLKKHQWVLM